jgi:hypothetical protein
MGGALGDEGPGVAAPFARPQGAGRAEAHMGGTPHRVCGN